MTVRVLLTWYGSLHGHGTIGDLLALQAVANDLLSRGFNVRHISGTYDTGLSIPPARLDEVTAEDIDALVFVCGPLLRNHKVLQTILERFPHTPRIAVSVSLMKPYAANYTQPFDVVLAREGAEEQFEDVAILAPPVALSTLPSRAPLLVGLALRGQQGEYGPDVCQHERVRSLADSLVENLRREHSVEILDLEHHLVRAGCSPCEIEAKYQKCHLVITSRFHGGILALRNEVPFIAIDQIRGGAKVTSLLSRSGWPWIFRAEQVNLEILAETTQNLLDGKHKQELRSVADATRAKARTTLTTLALRLRNLT